MRVAVICLLLANVLFFAWAGWIDTPPIRSDSAAPVAALQLAERPGAPTRCWTAGPLPDEVAVSDLGAALSKQGIGSRTRSVEVQQPDGYLVYVDNLPDAQAKQRAIARLARAGIRDAAELPAGQPADRISVGLFAERDGAQQRLARVRATGLEVALEERSRPVNQTWLDIELKAGLEAPAIAALLAGRAVPAIAWISCPASSGG